MEVKKTKKQIITIAGPPGSGKSSTAKAVAAELNFRHFSSGDYFRELGRQRGVELLRANMSPKDSEELDRFVDERLRQIGATEDKMVIDSRTAWHWIPQSFKVFLDLNLDEAAKRILSESNSHRQTSEELHEEPEEYAKLLKLRLKSETGRYQKKYGINPYDMANYDLVVNTSANSLPEVVNIIVAGFIEWLDSKHG